MEESLSGDVLQQQDRDALITLLKYNDVKTEDLPYQLVLFYFENASLLQGLLFADCMGDDLRQVYASFMGQTKNSMGLKKALVAMYDGDGGDDSTSFVSLTLHNYREHLSCVYNTLQQSILKPARFHRQLPSDVLERHAALVALCQQKELKQKRCKNCKGKIHQSGQWHSLLKQQLVLVQGLRVMIMEIWRASRKSWGKDSVTVLRQGGAVVRKAADPTRVASWGWWEKAIPFNIIIIERDLLTLEPLTLSYNLEASVTMDWITKLNFNLFPSTWSRTRKRIWQMSIYQLQIGVVLYSIDAVLAQRFLLVRDILKRDESSAQKDEEMFIQQIFQVFEGWIDYISQSSIYYNCQSAMISIKKFWAQPKIKEYFERNKTKKKFLLNSLGRFQTADFFGPNFQLLGRKIMLYKGYVESIGRKDCDEPSTQTRALRQFAKFDSLWGKNPPKVTFSGDEKDPLVMCRTATPFGLSEEKLKKTHSVSLEMVESHLSHMGMARNFITLSLLRLQSVARSMKVDTTSVTRKVLDRMYDGDDDIFHTKLTFPTAPSFLKIHLGRDETDHKSPPQLLSQLVRTMDLDQQKTWLLQSAKHVNVFKLSDQERAEAEKIKEPEVFQHFLQDKLAELMVEKDEEFPEPPTLSAAKKEILMYESRIQELTREVSHLKSQSKHRHYEKGFLWHEQQGV